METINGQELKARLDAGGAGIRIMFGPAKVFESDPIPGSIRCDNARHAVRLVARGKPRVDYGPAPSRAHGRLARTRLESGGSAAVTHSRAGSRRGWRRPTRSRAARRASGTGRRPARPTGSPGGRSIGSRFLNGFGGL
jgi:hypothetical protein